jgi:hypothetical protein
MKLCIKVLMIKLLNKNWIFNTIKHYVIFKELKSKLFQLKIQFIIFMKETILTKLDLSIN